MYEFLRPGRSAAAAAASVASLISIAFADFPQGSVDAAKRLGENFAGGFYERDSGRALADLHPALSKLGVVPNIRRSGRDGVLSLPPGTLDIFALQHNADGHLDPAAATKQVTVLDATDNVVVFRLKAAEDWYDIWLASKAGGEWRLINCVFGAVTELEPAPDAAEIAAVTQAAATYGDAIARGDSAAVAAAAHLDFTRRSHARKPPRLVLENRETFSIDLRRTKNSPPASVSVLGVTKTAAAVRIDRDDMSEWVFLLKLDGAWKPVNSYWRG